jgi:hypothetical protein
MSDPLTLRARVATAAWCGLAGGLLLGLSEAWGILARNSVAASSAYFGLLGAAGFVIALDGLVFALVLALIGLVLALIPWPRNRLRDAAGWGALCVALVSGALVLWIGLDQFGVLDEVVRGARAALWAGLSLTAALALGLAAFWVARHALAATHTGVARVIRWGLAAVWLVAALLPIAYAVFGN